MNDQFNLSVFQDVITRESTQTARINSFVTASLGTLISLLIGGTFAFLVALTDIRWKGALVFCLMIPMMIPPQITALSWTQMMGPSSVLLNSIGMAPPLGAQQPLYSEWGIALLLGVQHTAIIFLTLCAGLRAIPMELVEAARISGAKGITIWWQIVLPLCLPSLAAGLATTFVTALGNFGIPAMLGIPAGYVTLPSLIYQRLSSMGPAILNEVAVLAIVISIVAIFGIFVQHLILARNRVSLVGISSRMLAIPLGAKRLVIEILLWLVIFLILVLPLIALLTTSLVSAYGVSLNWQSITLASWEEALFRQPATLRAFTNSFLLSVGAAFVLMLACVPLAWLMDRHEGVMVWAFDRLVDLPYALPGIVLAIAMILVTLDLPFTDYSLYGTIWIIFLAYLSRFWTVMLRPIQSAVRALDVAMNEAAQAAGASLSMRLRTIILPLVAPSAAAGAILVFLTAFNELTVSALLWSSGTETLGVVIFNLDDSGETVMASAVAMAIVFVIVGLMYFIETVSRHLPKGVVPWQN